jgi:hypothetical protein
MLPSQSYEARVLRVHGLQGFGTDKSRLIYVFPKAFHSQLPTLYGNRNNLMILVASRRIVPIEVSISDINLRLRKLSPSHSLDGLNLTAVF